MAYEPIVFIQDSDGSIHFESDALPYKTIIDIHSLPFRWVHLDEGRGQVTITLDGRTVVYERTAIGLHGEWLCKLRINPVVPGG